jgi:acyl-CoA hydrolase
MVSHVDHTEHDVQVIVTERGWHNRYLRTGKMRPQEEN